MPQKNIYDLNFFEKEYSHWNKPEYIHPDPLEFLRHYEKPEDQEIIALIAACLAYGNVRQILRSVNNAIFMIRESPRRQLINLDEKELRKGYAGFKHRFTTSDELVIFLLNIKYAIMEHGSLEKLFLKGYDDNEETIENALYRFVSNLNKFGRPPSLTPDPALKSSFKRICLFLRWMVRHDDVDLGIWKKVSPSKLIVPLDTHMRQVALSLGLTKRKDTSMKTALEITASFRAINPADPIKYDFALTRAGIRGTDE